MFLCGVGPSGEPWTSGVVLEVVQLPRRLCWNMTAPRGSMGVRGVINLSAPRVKPLLLLLKRQRPK